MSNFLFKLFHFFCFLYLFKKYFIFSICLFNSFHFFISNIDPK